VRAKSKAFHHHPKVCFVQFFLIIVIAAFDTQTIFKGKSKYKAAK